MGHPELILLDEPPDGTLPNIVQAIGRIIRRPLGEERRTVLIVEQNFDLIKAATDRCILIDKRSVVAESTTCDLPDLKIACWNLAIKACPMCPETGHRLTSNLLQVRRKPL